MMDETIYLTMTDIMLMYLNLVNLYSAKLIHIDEMISYIAEYFQQKNDNLK